MVFQRFSEGNDPRLADTRLALRAIGPRRKGPDAKEVGARDEDHGGESPEQRHKNVAQPILQAAEVRECGRDVQQDQKEERKNRTMFLTYAFFVRTFLLFMSSLPSFRVKSGPLPPWHSTTAKSTQGGTKSRLRPVHCIRRRAPQPSYRSPRHSTPPPGWCSARCGPCPPRRPCSPGGPRSIQVSSHMQERGAPSSGRSAPFHFHRIRLFTQVVPGSRATPEFITIPDNTHGRRQGEICQGLSRLHALRHPDRTTLIKPQPLKAGARHQ